MTIIVPEFPIYTPEWEWPEWTKRAKARADEIICATAIYGGSTGPALDTTVTAARWLSDTFTTGPPTDENDFFIYARGYAGDGADYFNASGINEGSIGADSFEDGGGTTRTLEHIAYYEQDGGQTTPEDGVVMGWTGASIANDTDAFYSIELELSTGGNQSYVRTSATYDASQNGMTMWIWENVAHNTHLLVANNDHDFIIHTSAP